MKLFEVRRGLISRAAWVSWGGALEQAAAARQRAACRSTAMPVLHNFAVHVSIGLQIFSKEEREKRKAKLKVRRVLQRTLHSALMPLARATKHGHVSQRGGLQSSLCFGTHRAPQEPSIARDEALQDFMCCAARAAGGDAARLL